MLTHRTKLRQLQYPFEFAKTRAQLKGFKSTSANPFSLIARIARNEGLGAIYTGCSTLILVNSPSSLQTNSLTSSQGTTFKAGIRFVSFDAVRNLFEDDEGRLSPSRGMLAGMVAGCVESVVAVTPTERVKTALYVTLQYYE